MGGDADRQGQRQVEAFTREKPMLAEDAAQHVTGPLAYVILAILSHLGLPTTLPRPKPARSPPQQDLDFGGSPNELFVDPPPSD